MDAPPHIETTADPIDDVVHWLTNGTRDQRFIDKHKLRKKFDELGLESVGNTTTEFAAVIKKETPE